MIVKNLFGCSSFHVCNNTFDYKKIAKEVTWENDKK